MTGLDAPSEIGYRDLPPDPSIVDAVGRHHSLATALADLIDNSVDAGSAHVLVRFLTDAESIHGLRVIDDGAGMDTGGIDAAMRYAAKRDYDSDDLGHFGLGMKAASLSQADELNVYSRRERGSAVGRRITETRSTRMLELDGTAVEKLLDSDAASIPESETSTGTVIEWRKVRTFLSSPDEEERRAWLASTIEDVRAYLGLVFHRLIGEKRVDIRIDEFDTGLGFPGASRMVGAIDPFGYQSITGSPKPSALTAQLDGQKVQMLCHIWPASQLHSPEYRLLGRPGDKWQGMFIYRNDRLLQMGGWNGIVHNRRDLALSRVEIDLDRSLEQHVTINPEKSGVELDADAREAVENATDRNGHGFRDFLRDAEVQAARSRSRKRRPISLVEPRRGFGADLIDAVADTVTFSEHGTVDIRWRSTSAAELVDVDIESRTLWLNSKYRQVLGVGSGNADDAPLFKMLLLLLYSRFFDGERLGAREKTEIQAWNELLGEALEEELEQREYRMDGQHGR